MATKLLHSKKDLDIKGEGKFGTYDENTGGGEPIDGGGRGAWERDGKKEKREPDQPRTADGKFTYNAVNGKELKDISKKNGHSRGTTVPPTLTGGENGVHFYADSSHEKIREDALDLAARKTGMSIEQIYHKGDKATWHGKIAEAPRDFFESQMEYIHNEKKEVEFKGALGEAQKAREELKVAFKDGDKSKIEAAEKKLDEAIDKVLSTGHYKGEPIGLWKKHEAETAAEKTALTEAKANKDTRLVDEDMPKEEGEESEETPTSSREKYWKDRTETEDERLERMAKSAKKTFGGAFARAASAASVRPSASSSSSGSGTGTLAKEKDSAPTFNDEEVAAIKEAMGFEGNLTSDMLDAIVNADGSAFKLDELKDIAKGWMSSKPEAEEVKEEAKEETSPAPAEEEPTPVEEAKETTEELEEEEDVDINDIIGSAKTVDEVKASPLFAKHKKELEKAIEGSENFSSVEDLIQAVLDAQKEEADKAFKGE